MNVAEQLVANARKKIEARTRQTAARELQGCLEPFRCGKGGNECKGCLSDFEIREAREAIAEAEIKALGYVAEYNPPPIPMRNCDWQFAHADYDGPEDPRCGCAPDAETCVKRILEIEEEWNG